METANNYRDLNLEEIRNKFSMISVHAPSLGENLIPIAKLLNPSECPAKKEDTICDNCEYFIGYYTPEGTVFAYATYEGFCKYGKE